jgi:flagellin-like hook-associated protein FlgL
MSTIGTLAQSQLLRQEIASLQGKIQTVQQQITSGFKTDRYGDLGPVSTLDINLRNQAERVDNYKTDIASLRTRTGIIDQSLNGIRSATLEARDAILKGLNSDTGRADIIQTARRAIATITDKLQANVDGRYLFAGTRIDQPPMVPDATVLPQVQALVANPASPPGPPGVLQQVPAPPSIPAAIQTAVATFFGAAANYYAGGPAHPPSQIDDGVAVGTSIVGDDPVFRQVLTALYTIASLPQPVPDPATPPNLGRSDFDATVQAAGASLSSGITSVEALVARNGAVQHQLDTAEQTHEATLTLVQTQINDIESVDLVDASARITQLRTQLVASFQLTSQLKDLSLVNFLK